MAATDQPDRTPGATAARTVLEFVTAVTEARSRRPRAARERPSEKAALLADQVSEKDSTLWSAFALAGTALHAVFVEMSAGDATELLRLADRIDSGRLPSRRRRFTFGLEAAACYHMRRDAATALAHLLELEDPAPEEFEWSPLARSLVISLASRAPPTLRRQATALAKASTCWDENRTCSGPGPAVWAGADTSPYGPRSKHPRHQGRDEHHRHLPPGTRIRRNPHCPSQPDLGRHPRVPIPRTPDHRRTRQPRAPRHHAPCRPHHVLPCAHGHRQRLEPSPDHCPECKEPRRYPAQAKETPPGRYWQITSRRPLTDTAALHHALQKVQVSSPDNSLPIDLTKLTLEQARGWSCALCGARLYADRSLGIHTADAGLLTDPTELWACAPACRTNR